MCFLIVLLSGNYLPVPADGFPQSTGARHCTHDLLIVGAILCKILKIKCTFFTCKNAFIFKERGGF